MPESPAIEVHHLTKRYPTGKLAVDARERRELDRRELYVGMTRARDGLWVGALGRVSR